MPIKVLVVDDSSFFRRRVSEIIERDSELTVIDTAKDGKDAIEKAVSLKPDVITMDVEMPVLDGISAVREIMAKSPTAILMFSSLTHDGAKATLDALDAGALDFLPKKFEDIARNRDDAVELLQSRIKQLGKQRISRRPTAASTSASASRTTRTAPTRTAERPKIVSAPVRGSSSRVATAPVRKAPTRKPSDYKIVAIGTSTGGPVALQKILTQIPANISVPILLIQHMPAAFTPAFAQRLNTMCKISVKEAENGDALKPGHAYLAPGGCQMMVEGRGPQFKLKVMQDESDRLTYKPSVDLTFGSVAKSYGGSVLSMVLTGMGADGREGARMLKSAGATIWAQDEATCVVYGMPQAVHSAGLSQESIALGDFPQRIKEELGLA